MKALVQFCNFFTLGISFFACAQARAQNCDSVLIQQIDWSKTSDSQVSAWVEAIDDRSYESAKTAAGGQAYFNMFSGSYESFKEKRTAFLADRSSFNSRDNAREAYKASLSSDQVSAWVSCKGSNPELLVTYQDVDREGAFIVLHWGASAAIGGLKGLTANFSGTQDTPDLSHLENFSGEETLLVKRAVENGPIRGIVSGSAGVNGQRFSAKVYVPAFRTAVIVVPVRPPTMRLQLDGKTAVSIAFWSGGNASERWNCLNPPSDEFDQIILQTRDEGLGKRRGACVGSGSYCDSAGESCTDQIVVKGCLVSRRWHDAYKVYLQRVGLAYSKESLCDENVK